jgi:hypothetical protein
MTRVVLRWLVLAPTMWVALLGVYWFGFRTIDVRFETFAALAVVPAMQAAVLTWAVGGRPRGLRRVVPGIARLPFGSTAALVDAALLLAGVVFWSGGRLGFGSPGSVQIAWAATKTLAAGAFLLLAGSGPRNTWRLAVGTAAAIVGVSSFTGWIGELPALVTGTIGRLPLVFAYLVTYGAVVTVLVVLLLRLGHTWPENSVGRLLVECSVAALLTASLILVLNGFKYRVPMEPYRGLALFTASIAASALLFAAETPDSKD